MKLESDDPYCVVDSVRLTIEHWLRLVLEGRGFCAAKRDDFMPEIWTEKEMSALSSKFHIKPDCRLHSQAEDYHFPRHSFLSDGYSPPGGYVKDFSVISYEGRLHLIHIDGRPGEVCWITGNEISFGHASTSDFQHWIRHPMPLAVGERLWESEHVWAPYVYKRGDIFYLFYMGSGQNEAFISYATSRDLERWERWAGGPITCAAGRDPFVFDHFGRTVLLYTSHRAAAVSASVSDDMISWSALPDILTIPGKAVVESSSMHPLNGSYILWFNDYGRDLDGFRAAYVLSDDPLHFDAGAIHEFELRTDQPDAVPSPELPVSKPIPLSIELIARGQQNWLVCYFRWHGDRNRLFFGEMDWSGPNAVITEITSQAQLEISLLPHQDLLN